MPHNYEFFQVFFFFLIDFPGGLYGKESAHDVGDLDSILGSGEGNGYPLQFLAWKIPWTEEPGRVQSMGSLRVGHD